MRKLILFIITFVSLNILLCLTAFSSGTGIVDNGIYENSNVVWTLYGDGSLVVGGSGKISSFSDSSDLPYLDRFENGDVKNLTINEGITEIGDYAFYGCSAESIEIASSVIKIGSYAFYGMKNAENITLSKKVASIGDNAFSRSEKLKISVDSSNLYYNTDEYGILYDYGKTQVIFCPRESVLTGYVLPETAVEINDNAFYSTVNLNEIVFPHSLKRVGKNAFNNCNNLASVTLNYGIELIEEGAFSDCNRLTDVCYTGNSKALSAVEMDNCGINKENVICGCCNHINTVVTEGVSASCSLPGYTGGELCLDCNTYTVRRIVVTADHYDGDADEACDVCGGELCTVIDSGFCCDDEYDVYFVLYSNGNMKIFGSGEILSYSQYGAPYYKHCDIIKSIDISEGITGIGANAFYGLYRLRKVNGGENITYIGESAFEGADKLSSVAFSNVETIEDSAFKDCALTDFSFGTAVRFIGNEAFSGCSFNSITLPETVESVSEKAFYSCFTLSEAIIGSSVSYIGENAFGYCTALEKITVTSFNRHFCDKDGILFDADCAVLIKYPQSLPQSSYRLPETVEKIDNYAFDGCKNLKAVYFCDGLAEIGDYAFSACNMIAEIVFNSGTETIGKGAFSYCTSLESVLFADSIKSIGDFAFSYCTSLRETALPSDLSIIYKGTFYCCENLETVTLGQSVEEIEKSAFSLCERLRYITFTGTEEECKGIKVDEFENGCFISAARHFSTHTVNAYSEVLPICAYEGYTAGTFCESCRIWLKGHEIIEAEYTDHDSGQFAKYRESTCTVAGEERAYCSRGCGFYLTRPLELSDHKYTAVIIKPTCVKGGFTQYTCSCGHQYEDSFTPNVSHSLSEYSILTPSTCSTKGKEAAVCEVCSTVFIRDLPLKKHVYSASRTVKPTCTSEGYTVYACSCGDSYNADRNSPLGHSFSSKFTTDKKSTCISTGSKSRHCIRCTAKTEVTSTEKLPHSYSYVIIGATTKKDGCKNKTCSSCGKIASGKKIYKIKSVTLSDSSYIYDGKTKKPSVKIKDSKGSILVKDTDYTLKYQSGRKKTGKYTVTVKFMGEYSGTEVLTFKIVPDATKKFTAKPSFRYVTLSWDKVKGATGYRIYYYNSRTKKYVALRDTENLSYTVRKIEGSELLSGTDYKFAVKAYKVSDGKKIFSTRKKTVTTATKPTKTEIRTLSYTSGKAVVKWKKIDCDGYELVYATNKSFSSRKTADIRKKSAVSYTLNGVQKGKTYYYKIRGYKTVNGEKIYGYYSDVKTLK